jgi:hypothetical protein
MIMNEIETIQDSISKATQNALVNNGEGLDLLISTNEKALGDCDRLLNHEMLTLEKHISEMESIIDAPPDEKKKMASLIGSTDDLEEILANIYALSEAREFLAARNAALT